MSKVLHPFFLLSYLLLVWGFTVIYVRGPKTTRPCASGGFVWVSGLVHAPHSDHASQTQSTQTLSSHLGWHRENERLAVCICKSHLCKRVLKCTFHRNNKFWLLTISRIPTAKIWPRKHDKYEWYNICCHIIHKQSSVLIFLSIYSLCRFMPIKMNEKELVINVNKYIQISQA